MPASASPHGGAVAAVAFHRHRGGPAQDLELDLRQAVHGINPAAFWHPALNGEPPSHPLVLDNPFLLTPYRTADGRWIMASGVYPHLAAKWCRFLDVPPDAAGRSRHRRLGCVQAGGGGERRGPPGMRGANPGNGWRTSTERCWPASRSSASAHRRRPGTRLRPGAKAVRRRRVLSFTHAVAGPVVGRTLAEHGADVLCATRPNDYEHEFIYAEANVGSRSAYLDLASPAGQDRAATLLADADVVVNNHRSDALERQGLDPRQLAERYPGLVTSRSPATARRPVGQRGGFDMNGSAASGLMTIEGTGPSPGFPSPD